MDAAGSHRRDDARGIAGEDHPRRGQDRHRSTAGNQSGAGRRRGQVRCQTQPDPHPPAQRIEIGHARAVGTMAEGQPELHAARRLRGPADVARRKPAVDEAVQAFGLCQPRAGEFVLDAIEEVAHAPQSGAHGHARLGTVGAYQPAAVAQPGHLPAIRQAARIGERLHQPQLDAGGDEFAGQPAHQLRRFGGQEVVAVSLQRHAAQVGGVQADTVDASYQLRRHAAQRRAFGGLADDDAGGMQGEAGVALAFEHADAQARLSRRQRAGRAGETRPYHHHVPLHAGLLSRAGMRGRDTLPGAGEPLRGAR